MITLFFQEEHENIRNACLLSFTEVLENCFVGGKYGKEGKPAKELVFGPLFDELQASGGRPTR